MQTTRPSGADYKTDLNLSGLKLKGKGYGGTPGSVSAPSTTTLGSGSMTIESDNKRTFLSVNVVTAKDANGAVKMFSSAGVSTP